MVLDDFFKERLKMSILVTGGLGFIGSHTTIELLEAGYDVVIIDNLSNSSKEIKNKIETITKKQVKTYYIDLLEKAALKQIFMRHHIESVIHFAGYKAVGESVGQPLKYYINNIVGTLNLCQVMDEFKVYHLVFSSSATVYGAQTKLPLTEESSVKAINPYGKTKLFIEEILKDVSNSNHKWKVLLFRYFNPVGAHPSGKIGEFQNGKQHSLIAAIFQVLTGELKYFKVFGGDYETKDGTCIRDYIHVDDLAKGHIAALKKIDDLDQVETFNLGTGHGYSVLEVIKTFERVLGRKIPYQIKERRPGDIAISYSDPTKANEKLNWKTEKTLVDMCTDVLRWEIKQNRLPELMKVSSINAMK